MQGFAAPDHTEPPAVSIAEATVDNLLRLWKPTLLWACGVFKCLLIAGAGPTYPTSSVQSGFKTRSNLDSTMQTRPGV